MKLTPTATSIGRRFAATVVIVLTTFGMNEFSSAATPEQLLRGQQLFTQEFTTAPLTENGDGLGPLFNHTSCAACHHAGGIGGAGDHRFNARTFEISSMSFDQTKTNSSFAQVMQAVAPGFVSADESVRNTFAMHRRGGSVAFDSVRQKAMATFNTHWSEDATVSSDDIHQEAEAKQVRDEADAVALTGHVHSRNTTALFGAGLIDLVPDSVLWQQVKAQQRHPEIHGRPATLADGRIGKFGWRANFATLLEFTENACVNELGLQSKRVPQPKDVMQTSYVNTQTDIDDESIMAMTAFIAALPTPTRLRETDAQHRDEISKGEQRFATIGCAVCHVPTVGPASGLFSDLLLHDMGLASADYNTAPPYRKNIVVQYDDIGSFVQAPGIYYGKPSLIGPPKFISNQRKSRSFRFDAPQRPDRTVQEPIKLGKDDVIVEELQGMTLQESEFVNAVKDLRSRTAKMSQPLGPTVDGPNRVLQRMSTAETIPTNFTQEWRTAPLWGLRDSAPYMHDGRAETVLEAIAMHGGESEKTRNRFFALSYEDQQAVLTFLDTFVAPQAGVLPAPKDFTRRHLAKN